MSSAVGTSFSLSLIVEYFFVFLFHLSAIIIIKIIRRCDIFYRFMAAGETDIDKSWKRFIYVCFSSSHINSTISSSALILALRAFVCVPDMKSNLS